MKKEVCFNINQLIWTTLHRLVRGTSYLFNVGLTHAHSVLFSSDRNETKVPILIKHIWENLDPNKKQEVIKIEISIWATLNSTVSYYLLVKDV